MDISGLVLGILSTVLSILGVGLVFGVIGLPLSIIGRSKAKKESKPTGIAITGIVLNSIGIAFSILFLTIFLGPIFIS